MSCLIIGDSIAVGLAALLPFCTADAAVGLPSAEIVGKVREAETLIVSAGSNDRDVHELVENLRAIREGATGQVVWVLPVRPAVRRAVLRTARERGDRVVSFVPSADRVHPRSYPELALSVAR